MPNFAEKKREVDKEGNQGFRFADDAMTTSPASVTNADTNIPPPPSPTTTIIIPAEKNSLHSAPAVHQPLPPGKGDLFCIFYLFFFPFVTEKLRCLFTPSKPAFNFLWVADVCCLSTPGDTRYLMSAGFRGVGWVFFFPLQGPQSSWGKSTETSGRLKSFQLPPQKLTAERLVVN